MKKTKKTKFTLVTEEPLLKALILGGEPKLMYALGQKLEEKGCQVLRRLPPKLKKEKIDYIFILGKLNNLEALFKALKTKEGKILLLLDLSKTKTQEIEAFPQIAPFIRKGFNIRALKVDRVSEFDTPFLVEKILKITFEKNTQGKIFSFAFPRKKIKKVKLKAKKPSPEKARKPLKVFVYSWRKLFLFFLVFFVLILLLTYPFAFFGFNLYQGSKNLKLSQAFLEKGEIIKAEIASRKALDNFDSSKQNFKIFKKTLLTRSLKNHGKNLERVLSLGQRLAFVSYRASFVGRLGSNLGETLLTIENGGPPSSEGPKNKLFKERLEQIKIELEQIDQELAFAEAEINELENWQFPLSARLGFKEALSEIKRKIPKYRQYINLGKKILPLFPPVLAFEGEKTFLLIFENNMELRPTGGFIGSFALLTFNQGKLLSLKVEDVYNADGQLKGHVEPPPPIRKFLDQPHWYLRDSNWDPDFAVNAVKAEWFLEKEIGKKVDGVISVDLTFAQNLLKAIGGVTLPDYKEVITADNLFLKAQFFAQKDFFPGSTQKRDFLGAVVGETLNHLTSNPNLPYFSLAQAIKKSLEGKHLMFYFHDFTTQRLVEELGWGGRAAQVKCLEGKPQCFADYLMLVEANLGVNKANYFVKKRIETTTEFLENGKIKKKLKLFFENNSPSEVFPGGTYKNYLRILTPEKTVFEELKIDNQKVSPQSIDKDKKEDKKIFGFYFETPPFSQKEIVFSYNLEENFNQDKKLSYQFLIQKQPGTEQDPLALTFQFPSSWKVSYLNFEPLDKNENLDDNQTLKVVTDLSVDRVFRISFKKP